MLLNILSPALQAQICTRTRSLKFVFLLIHEWLHRRASLLWAEDDQQPSQDLHCAIDDLNKAAIMMKEKKQK